MNQPHHSDTRSPFGSAMKMLDKHVACDLAIRPQQNMVVHWLYEKKTLLLQEDNRTFSTLVTKDVLILTSVGTKYYQVEPLQACKLGRAQSSLLSHDSMKARLSVTDSISTVDVGRLPNGRGKAAVGAAVGSI